MLKGAATAALFALAIVASGGRARADDIPAGPAPIVNVLVRSGRVVIAVWNRPVVRITSGGSLTWRRFAIDPARTPQINMWAQQTQTPRGTVALPQEPFVLPPIGGPRTAIVARGYGDTTVMLPQGTALVIARVFGRGNVAISGYQGALVAATRNGQIFVRSVTGTAFLQALRGRIVVLDSSFDRVRARTGIGPVIFYGSYAGQIDATSVAGAVLFDNGTLGQGPVHFASVFSNVGVGIAGSPVSPSVQSINGTATASIGTGGPVVTATSVHGRAFIYRGSLAAHPKLLTRWPHLAPLLRSRRFTRPHQPRLPGRPAFRRPPQ